MAVGAIVLTLFGAVWWIIALACWTACPSLAIPAASAATVVLLVLCSARLKAARKIHSFDDAAALAKRKRAGMFSGIVFGIESALVALCSGLLARHGCSVWIPMAMGIIVGLHFLPLARLWEMPLYYLTGVVSVLGILGCLLVRDAGTRLLCVGSVMTSVLWLTALLLLWQTQPVQLARL
jgi:hypothetical protein